MFPVMMPWLRVTSSREWVVAIIVCAARVHIADYLYTLNISIFEFDRDAFEPMYQTLTFLFNS